jgi:urease accessory protein
MMRIPMLFGLALLLPAPAFAHVGDAMHHGMLAGFLHPLGGVDHVLAMVMVGLWAGLIGGRARLVLPGGFVGGMAMGALLGFAGVAMPVAEAGILASIIVLGAVAALALRPPLVLGAALAAGFGLLHGHAHGTELLGGLALTTMLGMIAGTAMLHAVGLALASPVAPLARRAAQVAGGATAVAGVVLALA